MCAWRLTLEVSEVDSRFCQTSAASPAEPGVFLELIKFKFLLELPMNLLHLGVAKSIDAPGLEYRVRKA